MSPWERDAHKGSIDLAVHRAEPLLAGVTLDRNLRSRKRSHRRVSAPFIAGFHMAQLSEIIELVIPALSVDLPGV